MRSTSVFADRRIMVHMRNIALEMLIVPV